MKKILIAVSVLFALNANAQVLNNSFETWSQDTFYLAAGAILNLPADTSISSAPEGWTTSNAATDLDSLEHVILVTQSNTAFIGSSSIRMRTDSITVHFSGTKLPLTVPGFAVNGKFPINPTSLLLNAGTVISPASLKGSGQPINKRLAKIKGFYDYKPVFNPNTNANDTCIVWATLRKGDEIVAHAIFKSTDSTTGYEAFEADFKYETCSTPDTLVILLASSVPNVGQIANGLVRGSVLLVDSIAYDTLAANFNFPPIALNDRDTTTKNLPVTINVLANDTDCDNQALTAGIVTQPLNGTAIVVGNNIVYTPATDFTGRDTFVYRASTVDASDTARVFIRILSGVGISKVNEIPISVYPVPASHQLNIRFENPGRTTLYAYDMVGKLVLSTALTGDNNSIGIADLPAGFYGLQIMDEKNVAIARSTFVVSK